MSRNVAKRAANEIARQCIAAARGSGSDPIAWVTSNAMMPPLRWFDAAERIWQGTPPADCTAWESLTERVESLLAEAGVALECPDYDNALYVVDLRRFEYVDEEDREQDETLQDEWRQIAH